MAYLFIQMIQVQRTAGSSTCNMVDYIRSPNRNTTKPSVLLYVCPRKVAFVYCFIVALVVTVTETGKTTEVSCEFSKDACGYTVGECWALTAASVFDSSGN